MYIYGLTLRVPCFVTLLCLLVEFTSRVGCFSFITVEMITEMIIKALD